MRVDLDARVQTQDGKDAGSVQRAVIDPKTKEVTDFVVSTAGLFGWDVLVPRHDLERATPSGDVLRLDLTKDELEHLPAFDPAKYGAPPINWSAPGLAYPFAGYLWPTSYLPAPDIAPVSGEVPDEYTVTKGTKVYDHTGDEQVGVVDDVRFDEASGRLSGLVVRSGGSLATMFGRGEVIEIERAEIARVADRMVFLRGTKAELHQRFASKSELPR
ncbi:MAG: PRC-barrel domain-containing protein [Chloroflexota bacterium]|nr:PRC-barrel domain-containing protein [Chloroflexota bacterium]